MSPKMKHPFRALVVVMALVIAPLMTAPFWGQSQNSPQVIMGLQKPPQVRFPDTLPPGAMQAKANASCLECHEARIILQQRLSKPAWTKEVDKMIKWGAVVDVSDRDALIDYLSTNFSPDQLPYEPPRSAVTRKK